eukprot:TRINITY_DN73481_c0_g1_i1.p1 TRINITY_DN73481_c0_g1~~TRINITY_DN73481_c0_g1_i1.p1  ORF type:complete len:587 (-),score=103.58 TRINITY_DN73481_c0_g1_i1:68-1828(-)
MRRLMMVAVLKLLAGAAAAAAPPQAGAVEASHHPAVALLRSEADAWGKSASPARWKAGSRRSDSWRTSSAILADTRAFTDAEFADAVHVNDSTLSVRLRRGNVRTPLAFVEQALARVGRVEGSKIPALGFFRPKRTVFAGGLPAGKKYINGFCSNLFGLADMWAATSADDSPDITWEKRTSPPFEWYAKGASLDKCKAFCTELEGCVAFSLATTTGECIPYKETCSHTIVADDTAEYWVMQEYLFANAHLKKDCDEACNTCEMFEGRKCDCHAQRCEDDQSKWCWGCDVFDMFEIRTCGVSQCACGTSCGQAVHAAIRRYSLEETYSVAMCSQFCRKNPKCIAFNYERLSPAKDMEIECSLFFRTSQDARDSAPLPRGTNRLGSWVITNTCEHGTGQCRRKSQKALRCSVDNVQCPRTKLSRFPKMDGGVKDPYPAPPVQVHLKSDVLEIEAPTDVNGALVTLPLDEDLDARPLISEQDNDEFVDGATFEFDLYCEDLSNCLTKIEYLENGKGLMIQEIDIRRAAHFKAFEWMPIRIPIDATMVKGTRVPWEKMEHLKLFVTKPSEIVKMKLRNIKLRRCTNGERC